MTRLQLLQVARNRGASIGAIKTMLRYVPAVDLTEDQAVLIADMVCQWGTQRQRLERDKWYQSVVNGSGMSDHEPVVHDSRY